MELLRLLEQRGWFFVDGAALADTVFFNGEYLLREASGVEGFDDPQVVAEEKV